MSDSLADPTTTEKILRERSERLARTPEAEDPGQHIDLLVFLLAREEYAVAAADICEVMPLKALARLPGIPTPVAGLTGWRGDLLTVLDIRTLYGITQPGLRDNRRVLVASAGDDTPDVLGILVDDVVGIRRTSKAGLQPVPPGVAPYREALLGIGPGGMLVLDAATLVSTYY